MTLVVKYNVPTDIIDMIARVGSRVSKLERVSRPSSAISTAPVLAADYQALVSVTTITFVTTHYFPAVYSAPAPVVTLQAFCSDGTTGGEFRLTDEAGDVLTDKNGAQVAPTLIPVGTTAVRTFQNEGDLSYWDESPIGSTRILQLQVRRTVGTGTVFIRPLYLTQVPR
jgi:hypothetical protein